MAYFHLGSEYSNMKHIKLTFFYNRKLLLQWKKQTYSEKGYTNKITLQCLTKINTRKNIELIRKFPPFLLDLFYCIFLQNQTTFCILLYCSMKRNNAFRMCELPARKEAACGRLPPAAPRVLVRQHCPGGWGSKNWTVPYFRRNIDIVII